MWYNTACTSTTKRGDQSLSSLIQARVRVTHTNQKKCKVKTALSCLFAYREGRLRLVIDTYSRLGNRCGSSDASQAGQLLDARSEFIRL